MKTVIVKTKKVVSHDGKGMPVVEKIEQALSPELTFNKFCKYLPNQQYTEVQVLKVLESKEELIDIDGKKVGRIKNKEVDEIAKYQAMIDATIEPKEEIKDYKVVAEKQAKLLEEMQERLKALETKEEKPKATRGRKPKEEPREDK
jgi:hypothetical protein